MGKYLKQHTIDDIESAIYNDDNATLFSLLPKNVENVYAKKATEDFSKNQRVSKVEGIPIIVREDGRVYNSNSCRYMSPTYQFSTLVVPYKTPEKTLSIKLLEVFESNGWVYDHNAIMKNYKDNNWKVRISPFYRGVKLSDF